MNLRHPPCASWRTLEQFVREDRVSMGRLYKIFEGRPLTGEAIIEMQERRFEITFKKMRDYGTMYLQRDGSAQIELRKGMHGYNRDKTLMHELAHFWYSPFLNDGESEKDKKRRSKNCARTEWLARRARADPNTLFQAIMISQLEPKIYDRASYEAFSSFLGQTLRKVDYLHTRMD